MSLSKIHDIKPMKHYGSNYRPVSEAPKIAHRPPSPPIRPPYRKSSHHSRSGKGLWYVAGILILALFFGLSVFFTNAKVTITPTIQSIPLNERFIAHKKSVSKELTFDAMIVEGSVSQEVAGETKQLVEDKAEGSVRIFNNHGSESQALRIDTRLTDDKGRLYKTKEAVTVPGQTTVDGKIVPGSVEVAIYSDKAGVEFNEEGEITLKLIGFQEANSPKYETIYAKTTTPLEGGFVGERFTIEQTEKDRIVGELTQKLSTELKDKSLAQVPEQSLFPESLSTMMDTKVSETVAENGTVTLTVSGSLFNVLFNKVEFEKYILETSIVGVEQETAYIANLEDLAISYVDSEAQTVDPEALENIAFQINDVLEIISHVDKELLAFDLVGQKKKDSQVIIANHPGVEHVQFDVNPFWRSRFPDKDEDIDVVITTEVTE
jgi:hypothetical protein